MASLHLLKSATLKLNGRFYLNQRKEIKFRWKFHHQKFLHCVSVFWQLQMGKYCSVLGHLHCTLSDFSVGTRWYLIILFTLKWETISFCWKWKISYQFFYSSQVFIRCLSPSIQAPGFFLVKKNEVLWLFFKDNFIPSKWRFHLRSIRRIVVKKEEIPLQG